MCRNGNNQTVCKEHSGKGVVEIVVNKVAESEHGSKRKGLSKYRVTGPIDTDIAVKCKQNIKQTQQLQNKGNYPSQKEKGKKGLYNGK